VINTDGYSSMMVIVKVDSTFPTCDFYEAENGACEICCKDGGCVENELFCDT